MDKSGPRLNGSPTSEKSGDGGEKLRLTDEQKKQNHITSEQKRRQGIRAAFDKLCEIVPGLENQGRSEGHVLNQTTLHLVDAIEERKVLVAKIDSLGGHVPDGLRAVAQIDTSKVDYECIPQASLGGNSNSS